MKKFKLTTLLLAIITALTFGLTSCTDEIGSDTTTGEPGYLTINLKTLQPKQTKVGGDVTTDYQLIKDLNIFVFNGTDNKLVLDNFYDNTTAITNGEQTVNISISSLPDNSYVVAVANYGERMTLTNNITDLNSLVSIPITTVRDFAAHGLHMTGQSNIQTSTDGYTYTANVSIAPVEAKITVNWTLTNDVLDYYDVTGIYVVNAINQTRLPIIRNTIFNTSWPTNAIDNTPKDYINLIGATPTKTASTGLAIQTDFATNPSDYHFYAGMSTTDEGLLKDEKTDEMTSNVLDLGYTVFGTPTTSKFHYYVGENYSNNTKPNAGAGALVANATVNANTLVVIRVTPLSTAPDYIKAMEHKYYTYEFNRESTYVDATNLGQNGGNLGTGTIQADGFSVRRKTNYSLTFNLTSLGTADPFVRLRTLTVNVTADPWDNPVISATY